MSFANSIQMSADCDRTWAVAFDLQPTAVEGLRRDALCFTAPADGTALSARGARAIPVWDDLFSLEATTLEGRRVDALCFTVSPTFRAAEASHAV